MTVLYHPEFAGDILFFVLYGLTDDRLIFGSLIPGATDPLTWLRRFS